MAPPWPRASQLNRLGQAIKQLESSGKTVGKFQQLQRDTLLAKRAWMEAENQVKSLSLQMAATANPSKALVTEFERSKTAALKAKTAYLQKRDALHNLDNEIRKSGKDIQGLIAQQTKLGSSIEKLKGHYVALDRLMQKRQGILAQRANLRGQMFDAVALGATFTAPIKAAIDFESAMADVRKVVNFDTPDGLQKLGETLKIMSREIPLSAAGLAQIAASGGQLGIAAKDLSSFTNTASLITAIRMGALAFGGALQALGTSFMALASRVFPAVIAGFRALTVAMMSNPIGAIVGGIAIAATLVVTNWESVKNFFMTIWEPIKPVWEAFGDWAG